ncbi:PPDK_N domain-containing protein, partial [Haematococcus lacustris]
GKVYSTPVLLLAEHVGGNEDIPLGVQAVLTRSATDVLSHAAIRARAQRVLLATCHDEAQWEALQVQLSWRQVTRRARCSCRCSRTEM